MSFFKNHSHKIISYGIIAGLATFILTASLWYKEQHKEEDALERGIARFGNQEQKGIKERTQAYYIDVTYPIIASDVPTIANQYIRDMYTTRVNEFKALAEQRFATIKDTALQQDATTYYSIYNLSYAQIAKTTRYISLVALGDVTIFNDNEHSHNNIDTFVFDRKMKKLVMPEDMFIASPSYLTLLSKLTQQEFEKRGLVVDSKFFEPSKENFSKMVPTKSGLMIYIIDYKNGLQLPQYQQVVIPYIKLKSIIDKDGVLSDYVG